MGNLELFDLALSRGGGRTAQDAVRLADRLVQLLLGEVRYLWDLYLSFDGQAEPEAESSLRRMFEDWAQRAEAVGERVKPWDNRIEGTEELLRQHGRVRAMLSISESDLNRAREEIKAGRTYSLEEVRREYSLLAPSAAVERSGRHKCRPYRSPAHL